MIEITESDFQPLITFRLKWRWTKANYRELSQDPLAMIKPLSAKKAGEIWEVLRPFTHDDTLAPELFEPIIQVKAVSQHEVRKWLEVLGIDRDTPLIVSWQSDTAVSVPFGVFCDYWDDFCYPSSDDVIVCPYSESWAIFYHHEEVFFFGGRIAIKTES